MKDLMALGGDYGPNTLSQVLFFVAARFATPGRGRRYPIWVDRSLPHSRIACVGNRTQGVASGSHTRATDQAVTECWPNGPTEPVVSKQIAAVAAAAGFR